MKINTKKSLINKIIFSNFLLLICFLFIIFFSTNLIRDFINKKQINKEIKRLEKDIGQLTEKNQQLTNLLSYIESQDFIEEEARLKLNKKKAGEEIIIVPNETLSTMTILDVNKKISKPNNNLGNNLINWWHYFFINNL